MRANLDTTNYLEDTNRNFMNTNALIRISGMILLATAVSLVIVVLIYALQHYQAVASLATVSWNG